MDSPALSFRFVSENVEGNVGHSCRIETLLGELAAARPLTIDFVSKKGDFPFLRRTFHSIQRLY